jgi:TPP-dependent indolepyruvate ferredoxin oxidoreductase alpha subunit
MQESVTLLKKLHAIQNIEQAIFALERAIPVPPHVIETVKTLREVMIADYNATIEEGEYEEILRRRAAAEAVGKKKEDDEQDDEPENESSDEEESSE